MNGSSWCKAESGTLKEKKKLFQKVPHYKPEMAE